MPIPNVLDGKLTVGMNVTFGEGVVIDVAEEVVIGNRCIIPDHAYLSGRKISIGNDFYGYSWEYSRLDIGRGRKNDWNAVLVVGDRCTFHDNRIDLSREVTIGDDVGLSPEVTIYTHGYWMSPLDGFPLKYDEVRIGSGSIIGYRSALLAGATVPRNCVIGAQSVVPNKLAGENCVYAGNPAVFLKEIMELSRGQKEIVAFRLWEEYRETCLYRGIGWHTVIDFPYLIAPRFRINLETRELIGEECEHSDDLRDFLFKHGIRVYTQRPFRKIPILRKTGVLV